MKPLSLFKSAVENLIFSPTRYNTDQGNVEAAINKFVGSIASGDSGASNIAAKEIEGIFSNLTGTVSKVIGEFTLNGVGTSFTTEVIPGMYIVCPGGVNEVKKIAAIASDTVLTVETAFTNTAAGQIAYKANDVQTILNALKTIVFANKEEIEAKVEEINTFLEEQFSELEPSVAAMAIAAYNGTNPAFVEHLGADVSGIKIELSETEPGTHDNKTFWYKIGSFNEGNGGGDGGISVANAVTSEEPAGQGQYWFEVI